MTIELEEHGQDFLRFVLRRRIIVRTLPFQGWVWNGMRVVNRTVKKGTRLVLARGEERLLLRYPVKRVVGKA